MMTLTRSKALAISTTAIIAMFSADVPQASAQTLFDLLFRGDRRERQVQSEPMPAPVQRAVPRVSGPSYYTYKTEPLVRVDFAAIKPERSEDAALFAPSGVDTASVGSTGIGDRPAAVDETVVAQLGQAGVTSDAAPAQLLEDAVEEALEEVSREPAEATAASDDAMPVETEASVSEDPLEDAGSESAEADTPAAETIAGEAVSGSVPVDDEVDAAAAPAPAVGPETAEVPPPAASAPAPVEIVEEAPASQPLTDAQITGLQEYELMAEKEAAEAIVAHYTAVPEFIWVTAGRPNEQARAALRVLGDARSHGLNPADYGVAVPAQPDDAAIAAFEMELSARLLRYVRDARSGRIDPNRISGYHDFEPKDLDLVAVLQLVRDSEDVGALLEAQHPQNRHYNALRVELEMLRASAENEIVIAPGTLVRPGETNAEFPKILTLISQRADDSFRTEFGELLDLHLGGETYARELVPVIKAAQKAAGVGDDGVIGPRTIQALAGESKAGRIAKVEVALEQLRWLPSELADRHVFINAPAFNATYVEDGEEKLSMRTVVGGTSTQTYFFQDEIEYVEFHPYWGVPKSILVNKYLPKLINDPSYLDRAGFEVVNSRGQKVSSSSVNWGQYGANVPFDVRQRPGQGNALGELKIMFPNRHAIYMHDTPDKHLFDRENRALSNGCVRLQDPRGMAAAVLGWDRERLSARLDQPHSRENLSVKVPVYVAYFTAWAGQSGEVTYYNDVYGRDDKMRAAIKKVDALRTLGA